MSYDSGMTIFLQMGFVVFVLISSLSASGSAAPGQIASDDQDGQPLRSQSVRPPDPAVCVSEIKKVCHGLEDQLETCLQNRGQTLSQDCRDQLEGALTLARNGAGPGACLSDITRFCGGLGEKELAQCIAQKKDSFSKPCQDYLASVQSTAKQSTTPE
jgi:hypothetical protein